MSDPFMAEIRIFPYTFAPKGWAMCDGQWMPIPQNTALFSLLGDTYGGDGVHTFALPSLGGRFPMHAGNGGFGGMGVSPHVVGEKGGASSVALSQNELPSHAHQNMALSGAGSQAAPGPSVLLADTGGAPSYTRSNTAPQTVRATLGTTGNGQPHNNMPPYLAVNFCICLQGVFPSFD